MAISTKRPFFGTCGVSSLPDLYKISVAFGAQTVYLQIQEFQLSICAQIT